MKKSIDELKLEILSHGLHEVPVSPKASAQVHRFVDPNYHIGPDQNSPLRTFTTYDTGYVRRNNWGYMGNENVSLNKSIKRPDGLAYNVETPEWAAFKNTKTLLLFTEEERLERLLVYLQNRKTK